MGIKESFSSHIVPVISLTVICHSSFLHNFATVTSSPWRESDQGVMWVRRTGREDVLHSGVRGEHLAHELLLLLPEVVLQVVGQHDVAGLLHGHHLAEHLQLWPKHSRVSRVSVSERYKGSAALYFSARHHVAPCVCSGHAKEYNSSPDLSPHSANLLYNWSSLQRLHSGEMPSEAFGPASPCRPAQRFPTLTKAVAPRHFHFVYQTSERVQQQPAWLKNTKPWPGYAAVKLKGLFVHHDTGVSWTRNDYNIFSKVYCAKFSFIIDF